MDGHTARHRDVILSLTKVRLHDPLWALERAGIGLYRDYVMPPMQVLIWDPCAVGLRESMPRKPLGPCEQVRPSLRPL